MKNQLTTGIAVFAATSVLFLGIGAAIAATTTVSPFAPGSLNAVSCAAGSGQLKNFSVKSESESVSCPLPTTTTTVAPTTTTTTGTGTGTGTPPLSNSCSKPETPVYTTTNYEGTYNTDPGVGYWWVNNDVWSPNPVTPPTQTLQVCSQSSWNAIANVTARSGSGVQSYPDTEYDIGGRDSPGYPSTKPISAYTSITSTFSESFPTTGDSFDAAYDLWTNNFSHETMIWNQYGGTQTYAATYAPNIPVTLDGVAYHYHNFGGVESIFTRDTQVSSGSVDILAAYQWEVANGYALATDAPTQLEYGIELCATTGTQTFPLTGLTFSVS
jgi:hypothetical protein